MGKEEKATTGGYKELRLTYESCFSVACTGMTVTLVELVEKGIGDDEDEMPYFVL